MYLDSGYTAILERHSVVSRCNDVISILLDVLYCSLVCSRLSRLIDIVVGNNFCLLEIILGYLRWMFQLQNIPYKWNNHDIDKSFCSLVCVSRGRLTFIMMTDTTQNAKLGGRMGGWGEVRWGEVRWVSEWNSP